MYFNIKLCLFTILFIVSTNGYAQKLPADARKILNDVGLSESEASQILLQKGIDINNINENNPVEQRSNNNSSKNQSKSFQNNLRDEIEKENVISVLNNDQDFVVDEIDESGNSNDTDGIEEELVEKNNFTIFKDQDTEYFGYKVFGSNPEIFEKSFDESIDPNYLIGPGDEVIIMLWGETEFQNTYSVSRDGYLFIENVGQIFVNGLTLEKLEQKLFRYLKKVYASLDNSTGSATTFFDVSLGGLILRPLRIFVLGNVNQPGAYAVKPSTTLFTSLYYFNGPTTGGSLRSIKLIRKNKEISEIDFYDYLLSGKQVNDTRLQRDDVIYIPPIGKIIKVHGAVDKNMFYELKNNEGLLDLIKMMGGLSNTIYMKRIQIDRIINFKDRIKLGMDRTVLDIDIGSALANNKNINLYDGDVIEFFDISDYRNNIVKISGQVKRPGIYELSKNLKLNDLIKKSDGLLGDVYMERVDVVRIASDGSKIQLDFDLSKVINDDPDHNIMLTSNDEVIIYKHSSMKWVNDVTISGHVLNPGGKEFRKGMQVFDLVFSGGGFENDKFLKMTYLDRADLYRLKKDRITYDIINFRLDSVLIGKGMANFELQMGDEIRIYSIDDIVGVPNEKVSISGFVKRSGNYRLYDGLKLKELLFLAGGFQDEEFKKDVIMFRGDLIRKVDNGFSQVIIPFNLDEVLNSDDSTKNILLKPDDNIRIYSNNIFKSIPTVLINGDIKLPGTYNLKDNMLLLDLILEAGGVENTLKSFRADISRRDDVKDENNITNYSFQIENNLNLFDNQFSTLKNYNGFKLKDNDLVTIRKNPLNMPMRKVSMGGYVNYPGQYILLSPNDKVTDILERAGGLRVNAYPRSSVLIRGGKEIKVSFEKIIRNKRSKFNFVLMDGDSIEIGFKPNLITIEGEFNSPGNFQFTPGLRLKDYIQLAGGLNDTAAKGGVFITYPNGESKRYSKYMPSPKVYDGSKIVALKKENVEQFNLTEYMINVTEFWVELSQAYLMMVLAFQTTGNS